MMILGKTLLAGSAIAHLGANAFVPNSAPLQVRQAPTSTRAAATRMSASPVATGLDILQVLSNEHSEALDMLKKMKESTNPEEMRILNDKVIIKLVQHSIVEETLVYPLITEKLPGGREATNKDKEEHHRLEELMRDLEKSNPTQPNFNEAVDALTEALKHHASKEDKEQFPALRKAVPDEVLHGIVMKAEALKQFSPTHPHPVTHLSHSKEFNTVVGPVVGLADRVRDAVTGRTTDELSEVSREGYGKDN